MGLYEYEYKFAMLVQGQGCRVWLNIGWTLSSVRRVSIISYKAEWEVKKKGQEHKKIEARQFFESHCNQLLISGSYDCQNLRRLQHVVWRCTSVTEIQIKQCSRCLHLKIATSYKTNQTHNATINHWLYLQADITPITYRNLSYQSYQKSNVSVPLIHLTSLKKTAMHYKEQVTLITWVEWSVLCAFCFALSPALYSESFVDWENK